MQHNQAAQAAYKARQLPAKEAALFKTLLVCVLSHCLLNALIN